MMFGNRDGDFTERAELQTEGLADGFLQLSAGNITFPHLSAD